MKSKLFAAFFVVLSLVTSHIHAQSPDEQNSIQGCARGGRTPAQIINYDSVAITTGSGKTLTAVQVRQAIIQAADDAKWTVSTMGDDKLTATFTKRNKHTISVDIAYAQNKYSVQYKSSTNMNYAFCNGKGYIHPYYNRWVGDLKRAIDAKLQAL